jgi:hypothetical protein
VHILARTVRLNDGTQQQQQFQNTAVHPPLVPRSTHEAWLAAVRSDSPKKLRNCRIFLGEKERNIAAWSEADAFGAGLWVEKRSKMVWS